MDFTTDIHLHFIPINLEIQGNSEHSDQNCHYAEKAYPQIVQVFTTGQTGIRESKNLVRREKNKLPNIFESINYIINDELLFMAFNEIIWQYQILGMRTECGRVMLTEPFHGSCRTSAV